ncbi:hypothetical protein ABZ622_39460 [Streptomyces sp. NPDC007164]|uniref:hypothetical protein n=1 Tax=Streptomyces sp. NPDC007164 TaxID=3156918 RepID=UPI0033C90E6B
MEVFIAALLGVGGGVAATIATLAFRLAKHGAVRHEEPRRLTLKSSGNVRIQVVTDDDDVLARFAALKRRLEADKSLPSRLNQRHELAQLQAEVGAALLAQLHHNVGAVIRVGQRVPDLMDVTESVEAGQAVSHLAQGFDDLFRALGPPPAGLAKLEPTGSGDGGTAR